MTPKYRRTAFTQVQHNPQVLRTLLYKAGVCPDCGSDFEHQKGANYMHCKCSTVEVDVKDKWKLPTIVRLRQTVDELYRRLDFRWYMHVIVSVINIAMLIFVIWRMALLGLR